MMNKPYSFSAPVVVAPGQNSQIVWANFGGKICERQARSFEMTAVCVCEQNKSEGGSATASERTSIASISTDAH